MKDPIDQLEETISNLPEGFSDSTAMTDAIMTLVNLLEKKGILTAVEFATEYERLLKENVK